MSEILQSEKLEKDKEKDKKSEDTLFKVKASMMHGAPMLQHDASLDPLAFDTSPQTPKTSTPPDTPLSISPVKVCAHAHVS